MGRKMASDLPAIKLNSKLYFFNSGGQFSFRFKIEMAIYSFRFNKQLSKILLPRLHVSDAKNVSNLIIIIIIIIVIITW